MPTREDILAQTELALTQTHVNINGFYFVAAHTLAGTRFYSDPIATFEMAEDIFNSYVDTISYFEGGSVEMYQIFDDDYEIISFIRI